MGLILNIDTAESTASICLARDGILLDEIKNDHQKDHASILHLSIELLLKKAAVDLHELTAISVNAGPGSYTGLRVAMAAAKGLCYALNKPLICVSSLELLAAAAIESVAKTADNTTALFCPMIDARRMEVFTALYDYHLNVLSEPAALVLEESSFVKQLLIHKLYFIGSGAPKWEKMNKNENAAFIQLANKSLIMCNLSHNKELKNHFADIAYCEPFYIKEFVSF